MKIFVLLELSLAWNFLHLTDVHWDPNFTDSYLANEYCHSSLFDNHYKGVKPYFGKIGSQCDSPTPLINATFSFISSLNHSIKAVFLTGDLARHDRDSLLPRSDAEVNNQIKEIIKYVSQSTDALVLPTIGNWDTYQIGYTFQRDYSRLFDIWKALWTQDQQDDVFPTFLAGGYYSLDVKSVAVISVNTIDWFVDNRVLGDCNPSFEKSSHPGDIQFQWLNDTLATLNSNNQTAILIGHVPPMTYKSEPLYKSNCLISFTNIIGKFSDTILSQYYGHVNLDVTYLVTRKEKYEIIPLRKQKLLKSTKIKHIVGQFYTGPSILPFSNPSFRLGVIQDKKLVKHVQYYADIEELNVNHRDEIEIPQNSFYSSVCDTSKVYNLKYLDSKWWKVFLDNVQIQLKENGFSYLLDTYKSCQHSQNIPRDQVEKSKLVFSIDTLWAIIVAASIIFLACIVVTFEYGRNLENKSYSPIPESEE
ncbi:Endopolyphosphatase [Boothiomyces sp. JEL0866]|nr:Endopolyphosphatase [Boothiomyces sp. JEL0866]